MVKATTQPDDGELWTPLTDEQKLWSTAYHEAGHAAMSHYFGVGVRRVSIVESGDGETAGHNLRWRMGEWFKPDAGALDTRTRLRLEREILIVWAGPLAEEKHAGFFDEAGAGLIKGDGLCVLEPGSDVDKIQALSSHVAAGWPDEATAVMDWLEARCRRIISRPDVWPVVEHVAAALMVEREFGRTRLKEVIEAADRNAPMRGEAGGI